MTDDIQMIEALEARAVRREGRRAFFKAALGAAAVGAGSMVLADAAQAATVTELDVLNFALNLEYLEANFYSFAVYGVSVDASPNNTAALIASGSGAPGLAATGGSKVTFTDTYVQQIATEIAEDEIAHVKFLRNQLKTSAIAQPKIDLSPTGAFAKAAAGAGLPATFNPYASDENFLLAAFIFEDVGVTAYNGAASLLTTAAYLDAASGLLSVEAQHAAAIRTALYAKNVATSPAPTQDLVGNAQKISDYRDTLDGTGDADQGILDPVSGTPINISPTDATGLVFTRTPQQVLNIAYLASGATATSGGFFPSGVNGTVKSTATA